MTSVLDEVRLPRSLAQANEQLRREIAAHEATRRELAAMRREQGRLAEQLGAEIQRYETALRGSNVAVYTQDLNLRYTAVSKPLFGIAIDDLLGRTDDDVLPAESRAPIVALKRQVLEGGISKNGEFRIEERWYDFHIEPLRDVTGGIVGLTCAAVDVTERKKGEEHLRLVMRELTHRSKNLLAVIQAMARQTARHTPGADGFLDRFAGRLQALACSHDLLVQQSWHGASLDELLRAQLAHYIERGNSQVSLEGPAVVLKPEAAQSLGLAFHELTTNAAKYGSLAEPKGRVAIQWRVLPPSVGGGIEILWRESEGPKVAGAKNRGFGSMAVEQNLRRALDAEVELHFLAKGLRCRIVLPAAQLAAGP
jgi:PAS domain S-box-containing protein